MIQNFRLYKMRKIFLLATALFGAGQLMAQQPATMITKLNNGATIRTDVSEVEKIVFTDTLYTLNSDGDRILEANELCWPEDRLLPSLLPPASKVISLDMSASRLSDEERVMFCTLQGIVNRTRPRILLYNHNEEPQKTWPDAHSLNPSPVSTPYDMVKPFKDEIKGLVLYDKTKSEHYCNLAATIAGLDRLLPVTAEIKDKLTRNGIDLPVVTDLTQLTMTSATAIYTYLYDNYWSRCNHRLLISERPTIPYVHDIGAACGSACVWLDPRKREERVVLDKMLQDMKPGRDIVLGWYPEERSGVGEATKYGLSSVPADFFENTSIYSAVKKPIRISTVPKRPKLENKIYASVYISDGDNIQYCQHAMAKIFNQGGRGKMAMNWTISPALVDFAPMMLNYYYSRATTNDCFVSGPSGLGYAMPFDAHNNCYYNESAETITPYVKLSQRYIEKAGLRVITIWDNISAEQRKVFAEHCPYLYGLTINDWERQAVSASTILRKLSIVPLSPCYANGVDVITDFFNRKIKDYKGTAPVFVTGQATVWDAGPDKLIALNEKLDNLSPGNVKIVRADHWFSYYNEAHHMPFNLTMLEDMVLTASPGRSNTKNIADGSPSQVYSWTSRSTDGTAWVQFDFKQEYKINRFVIRHAEAADLDPQLNNRDFTVETSLDGETWTTAATFTGNTAPVNDVTFTTVKARYVRVNFTKGGTDGYVRIADIEVYGSV